MDFWVVAAAAGAGYLAKYWNRISKIGDGSCRLASVDSYSENPESPSCSFPFLKQAWREKLGKDVSFDRWGSDVNSPDGLWTAQVASNRGLDGEKVSCIWNFDESNVLSLSNLPVSFSPNDSFEDIENGNEQSSNVVGSHGFFPFDSSAEVVHIGNSSGSKTFLRSKYLSGHISRPLNSLESCFMAQFYNEHAKMEEYVFSSLLSPSTAARPFLVSDGSRIISRANDSFSPLRGSKEYKLHEEACQVRDENVFGAPSLPEVRSSNDAEKMKLYAVTGQSQRSSYSNNLFREECIHTQPDATFLFSLGISFGIIFSIIENKREMDELRDLLKQTENLIEDLQEELDMKDSMTVKELHNENYGLHDTCEHSFYEKVLNEFSPEKHSTPKLDRQESYDQREEQSLESMSKIEAELEAELERLGLDMNASSLERKLSELVELDPEFAADFARGELRADLINAKDFINAKPNEDADDNYGVSPHELSLRLHEIVESQLEDRVKELEIALENSQRKVRLMESKHKSSPQKSSPIAGGNILTYEDSDPMHQPLILNLSGEALDAYNEAYEELIKMDDSEEYSPLSFHDSNNDHKESSLSHDWHALGFQHGDANGSITCSRDNGGKVSSSSKMLEGKSESICDLNVAGDESCSYDNEIERQLIRQIVEKSKKGSPVFQNAQRILHSMYED